MTDEEQGIYTIAAIALVVVLISHFVFGRVVTHIIIAFSGIGVLIFATSFYTQKEQKILDEIKAEEERKEAEIIKRREEENRRKKERERTIREAAKTKAISYIADMRRATVRLDGSSDNARKVAMAIDEILNSLSMDSEINADVLSSEDVKVEAKLVRDCLEDSLLRDHLVAKRFDKIL